MAIENQTISPYTSEEITAFYDTKTLLISQGMSVENMERITLFLCVMICKMRPDKAATKYTQWLIALKEFGINSFQEVVKDLLFYDDEKLRMGVGKPMTQSQSSPYDNLSNDEVLQANDVVIDNEDLPADSKDIQNKYELSRQEWIKFLPHFDRFAGAGLDNHNRSVMWIRAGPCPPEHECISIRVGILIWAAIHADSISMRNGITFVIDTDLHDMTQQYGNERKLLKYRQFIPLRPQKIYILGAGYFKRVIINAALAFASLFQSEKISDRICFADLNDIRKEVSEESMPVYTSSSSPDYDDDNSMTVAVDLEPNASTKVRKPLGGGIVTSEDFIAWTKKRLQYLIDTLPPFEQPPIIDK